MFLSKHSQRLENVEILLDDLFDTRMLNLENNLCSIHQGRGMHLRNRGRSERLVIKRGEDFRDRMPEFRLDR